MRKKCHDLTQKLGSGMFWGKGDLTFTLAFYFQVGMRQDTARRTFMTLGA